MHFLDSDATGYCLPEINEPGTVFLLLQGDRGYPLCDFVCRAGGFFETPGRSLPQNGLLPWSIVHPGIVNLSHIDIIHSDFRFPDHP